MKQFIFSIIAAMMISSFSTAQKYEPTWESLDSRPNPQWFPDAKFGIFIHWGLYAVPAWAPSGNDLGIYDKYAEWYWHRIGTPDDDNKELNWVRGLFRAHHEKQWGKDFSYQNFASLWKAENFNPDQWAEIFKNAGAKYVVLTSKHHEGFTLWPSAQSWNWNSMDIGPRRDICGELNQAVRKQGLHMGYYYSLYEWFNPLYKNNVNKYVDDHMLPQMKDLINRYEPDVLWTDGQWDHNSDVWKSTEFLAWLFNESKVKDRIVVNDRWGLDTNGKHGGFFTTEYEQTHANKGIDKSKVKALEECRGIGGSFGYNQNETLSEYMTSKDLIHLLVRKVANGSNLLLNIGPTADGRIPVIMQQRLADMGSWLKVNGEAIYETTKWNNAPDQKSADVFFTQKGSTLYVICTNPKVKSISVSTIKNAKSVSLLGSDGRVNFRRNGMGLIIDVPAAVPETCTSSYARVYKIEGASTKEKHH
jgi:alpha-L-fucosidase